MSVVRREINLSDLDIAEVRPRRAVTGVLIFEIARQDASSKTSRLTEKMAGALRDIPAKVTIPRSTVELRVTELESSITPEEVIAAVTVAGGCHPAEVSVSVIRAAPRSLGLVWLHYPLTAARKIGGSNGGGRDAPPGGKLHIGWSVARVSPHPAR
jgi:hypothetical protein